MFPNASPCRLSQHNAPEVIENLSEFTETGACRALPEAFTTLYERLHEVEKEVAKLAEMLGDEADNMSSAMPTSLLPMAFGSFSSSIPGACPAGRDLTLEVRVSDSPFAPNSLSLHYHMNQMDGLFVVSPMDLNALASRDSAARRERVWDFPLTPL
jgi:hypothetical protein